MSNTYKNCRFIFWLHHVKGEKDNWREKSLREWRRQLFRGITIEHGNKVGRRKLKQSIQVKSHGNCIATELKERMIEIFNWRDDYKNLLRHFWTQSCAFTETSRQENEAFWYLWKYGDEERIALWYPVLTDILFFITLSRFVI